MVEIGSPSSHPPREELQLLHPGAKSLLFAGSFGSDALLDAFNGSLEFHPAIGEESPCWKIGEPTKNGIKGTLISWDDNPDGGVRKQVIDVSDD